MKSFIKINITTIFIIYLSVSIIFPKEYVLLVSFDGFRYDYSNIVDNWTTMVNKKISDSCYPISIKMGKEMKNATLVLNVIPTPVVNGTSKSLISGL